MQNTIGEPHTRSGSHYLTAILIMGIYGGQVCPLVETLKLLDWFIELRSEERRVGKECRL